MIRTVAKIGRGILAAIGIVIGWLMVLGFAAGVIFGAIGLIQGVRFPQDPYNSASTIDILPLAIPLMILAVWIYIKAEAIIKKHKEKRRVSE